MSLPMVQNVPHRRVIKELSLEKSTFHDPVSNFEHKTVT